MVGVPNSNREQQFSYIGSFLGVQRLRLTTSTKKTPRRTQLAFKNFAPKLKTRSQNHAKHPSKNMSMKTPSLAHGKRSFSLRAEFYVWAARDQVGIELQSRPAATFGALRWDCDSLRIFR